MPRMKAIQVSKPGGDFELVERDIPEPARGQVRIKFWCADSRSPNDREICSRESRRCLRADERASSVPGSAHHGMKSVAGCK